jgi:predicted RNA binding protein YcfA (HicA-like mRNA interferase family)
MTQRLPRVTSTEIIKVLTSEGFVLARQSGSHKVYKNAAERRTTVPFHGHKILHPKLLQSICRDADISMERLKELLSKI